MKLTLLHTNDLHGRVHPLMRIASLVRSIKQQVHEDGGFCRYLDCGDCEDTTLLESCLTRGSAMDAILHAAGCDLAALGNAIPIRYGEGAIVDLAGYFGRPLLCANLKDARGATLPGLVPYLIEKIGPLKIGWIGLTAPLEVYPHFFHLQALEPVEIMPGLIREVREQGAKTVIVLSHLGSDNDTRLAEAVPGMDVILGGHDHQIVYPPARVNGTILAEAGDLGRFLGRLDLEIDPATGRVISCMDTLIPVEESIGEDPAAQAAFEEQQQRALKIMSIPVGELLQPVELDPFHECAAGNLLADALLNRVEGAQLALVIPGHWTTGLEAGLLTQGKLYAALRSTGNPAKVTMTGAQIEQFLCRALQPDLASRQLKPLRGNPVGIPHVAGITVRGGDLGAQKLEIFLDGAPLQSAEKYIVATSDLEISDLLDYQHIPDEEAEMEVPIILPEVVEDYIKRRAPFTPPEVSRIARELYQV